MKSFTVLQGLVAPMDRANVDTDLIIPKQFLKSIKRSGFGPNLFDELRYLDQGEPGQDCSGRPLNEDFPLNQARYRGASVLLARTASAIGLASGSPRFISMDTSKHPSSGICTTKTPWLGSSVRTPTFRNDSWPTETWGSTIPTGG